MIGHIYYENKDDGVNKNVWLVKYYYVGTQRIII